MRQAQPQLTIYKQAMGRLYYIQKDYKKHTLDEDIKGDKAMYFQN